MKLHTRLFIGFGVVFLVGGLAFAIEAILVRNPYLLGAGGATVSILILAGFFLLARRISWRLALPGGAAESAPAGARAEFEGEGSFRSGEVSPEDRQAAELVEICTSLEKTFEHFVRLVTGSDDAMLSIETSMEDQKRAVKAAAEAISSTVGSVDSIAANIQGQSAAVAQLSSTIEQMTASIKSVATVGRRAGELAETLSQKAESGGIAVSTAIDSIGSIRGFSEQIAEIITVMTDIANKTNLLSLNAAIEAAHAGDAGKGFSVVAGEIRKLAESAGESAKQISGLVKSVVRTINEASRTGSEAIERFGQIRGDVEQTRTVVVEISGATDEQTRGADEILKATTSLVSISEQVREAVVQQKTANSEAGRIVADLEAIAARAGELAHESGAERFPMLEAVSRLGAVSARISDLAAKARAKEGDT